MGLNNEIKKYIKCSICKKKILESNKDKHEETHRYLIFLNEYAINEYVSSNFNIL